MGLYRKKQVEVDAWQWLLDPRQAETPQWVKDALLVWPEVGGISFEPDHPDGARIWIVTLEGVISAQPRDWIMKGVLGELYPCKHDIFILTYENLDGSPI